MKIYRLSERIQARCSWVLHEMVQPLPKRARNPDLPPVMYQFFGPAPEGEMRMKPEYLPVSCPKCGRYDDDAVFDIGFREPLSLRVSGDFTHTEDRVFVVSDKFLSVIRKVKAAGYETKTLGKTGWHAFRVTERVDFSDKVMRLVKPICPVCERAKSTKGMFNYLRELSVPDRVCTFFTTKRGWPSMFMDRMIFATEDIVHALKAGGVKGAYCNRLLTDEEVVVFEKKLKEGNRWRPRGSTITL